MAMEMALCMLECKEPVNPLDIVRVMRNQRGMLIQTPVSKITPINYFKIIVNLLGAVQVCM